MACFYENLQVFYDNLHVATKWDLEYTCIPAVDQSDHSICYNYDLIPGDEQLY